MNETISHEELATFWKMAESNYIWIKVFEVFKDSYGIQMKIDYTLILRQERIKAMLTNRLHHIGVQVNIRLKCSKEFSWDLFLLRPRVMNDQHRDFAHRILRLFKHL